MAVPTRALPAWVTHAGVHVIASRAFPGESRETAFPRTGVPCAEVKGAIGLGSPLAASLCTAGAGTEPKPVPKLPLLQERGERQMQCLRCPGKGFLGLYSGGGITLKGSRHMERANSIGDASKWQWRREGNLTERFPGKRNSRKSCKETQLCQHGEEDREDSEKGIT